MGYHWLVGPEGDVDSTTTLEHGQHGAGRGAPQPLGPLLFRLLSADDPSQPSVRYSLVTFAEVEIGRSGLAGGQPRPTALRIDIRDPFASSRHAHLEGRDGGWRVRDEDSKNGTMVNGERAPAGEEVSLADGDLIEIGHTFFLFRGSARGVSESATEPVPDREDPLTLSPEWELELAKAARLSRTSHEVLIEGETGAGKEVLARFLHERSRRTGPLVCVNCAALPEALFEDELFGHVRGATISSG